MATVTLCDFPSCSVPATRVGVRLISKVWNGEQDVDYEVTRDFCEEHFEAFTGHVYTSIPGHGIDPEKRDNSLNQDT